MGFEFAQELVEEHQAIFEIVSGWCGSEHASTFNRIAELREEVVRLRRILVDTLNWMRDASEDQRLRWLKAKYVVTYRELNGENPPATNARRKT